MVAIRAGRRQSLQPGVDVGADDYSVIGSHQRPRGEAVNGGRHGAHLAAIALLGKQFRCELGKTDGVRTGAGARRVCLSQGRLDQHIGDGVGGNGLNQPVLYCHLLIVTVHLLGIDGEFVPLRGFHDRGRYRPVEGESVSPPVLLRSIQTLRTPGLRCPQWLTPPIAGLPVWRRRSRCCARGLKSVDHVGLSIRRHRVGHVDRHIDSFERSGEAFPSSRSTPRPREIWTTATSRA